MKNDPTQFPAVNGAVSSLGLGLKVILVPTDFSESARLAFRYALGLAEGLGGKVLLLNIVGNPLTYSMTPRAGGGGLVGDAQHKLDQIWQTEARESNDVQTIVRLAVEPIWKEIILTARGAPADLIVLPAHDGAGVRRFLFGDTIDKIARHAPCPVLMVPTGGPSAAAAAPANPKPIRAYETPESSQRRSVVKRT